MALQQLVTITKENEKNLSQRSYMLNLRLLVFKPSQLWSLKVIFFKSWPVSTASSGREVVEYYKGQLYNTIFLYQKSKYTPISIILYFYVILHIQSLTEQPTQFPQFKCILKFMKYKKILFRKCTFNEKY